MIETKPKQSPKVEPPKALTESFNVLGSAFKDWDGKDLKLIAKSSKDVLKYSHIIYKEKGNQEFLLCHFLIQYIISMLFSRTMFAGILNLKSSVPVETYVSLGDLFIALGQKVEKQDFHSSLLDVLAFVYDKELVPIVQTT